MATQDSKLKQKKMQPHSIGIYDQCPPQMGQRIVVRIELPKYIMDLMEIHTFFNPVTYVC